MPILEAHGLVKTYGRRRVVDGVSFDVEAAEIVGLLGSNGAGKSTSFKIACGLVEADAGKINLNGVDVTKWPMYRRAKEGGMGYLAQEASVFRKLTVEQNLLAVMELLGMDRRTRYARTDELLDQFKITHIRKSNASRLSGGERRRLEFARCLITEPEIILLDEPFVGIDPVTVQSIQTVIRDLKKRGIAILITDHHVRETLQITDRSYVMTQGRVLCDGPPDVVLSNPEARRAYFGEDTDFGSPGPPRPHLGEGSRRRVVRTDIHSEDTLDAGDVVD
ncbi:LPS export ABC transporter ATP-binding protein [Anatilimnocola floriformis]|uniref:LPS export ABC transporter ATP-binding protein n=1 Tax=Anatilimnocola floriformis TaxID=2948575 RepID=UPI0020C1CC5F|nr:LPS export ABC transporter ATP-binding protein [Anatilimnocola floriformis]